MHLSIYTALSLVAKPRKCLFEAFMNYYPHENFAKHSISLISSTQSGRVGLQCAYVCYSQIRDRLSDLKGETVHL